MVDAFDLIHHLVNAVALLDDRPNAPRCFAAVDMSQYWNHARMRCNKTIDHVVE